MKRSLGGRRGIRSAFVSPLVSGSESTPTAEASELASDTSSSKAGDGPCSDDRLKQFEAKTIELIMSEVNCSLAFDADISNYRILAIIKLFWFN
ncbi:unnamed protein product [Protopolystoma xenopodis]|uniref:Uncharacterized protein n=1 Tax=Protopolystoma xenopodis TaxID=117903 RepID=A0A3S5CFM0_9PLAT|nr:unnamed protein product [Protopolystoma xenopodis]